MKKSDVETLLSYIKRVFNLLLDFIFPQFCLNCDREGSICCVWCLNDVILNKLEKINWPNNTYFESCYTCCDYKDELVQKLIKYYKYNYLENIANLLVDILEKQARRLSLNKHTIIVNVPLHKNKKRKRGFDQTEILAKKLARRLNKPYCPLLIRTKDNKEQAKLDRNQRLKNVENIFSINKKVLTYVNTNILLIDDVTTTGSTLNQAARALGKYNVRCLVLAKNL